MRRWLVGAALHPAVSREAGDPTSRPRPWVGPMSALPLEPKKPANFYIVNCSGGGFTSIERCGSQARKSMKLPGPW